MLMRVVCALVGIETSKGCVITFLVKWPTWTSSEVGSNFSNQWFQVQWVQPSREPT
jgi:hypothetical protein